MPVPTCDSARSFRDSNWALLPVATAVSDPPEGACPKPEREGAYAVSKRQDRNTRPPDGRVNAYVFYRHAPRAFPHFFFPPQCTHF